MSRNYEMVSANFRLADEAPGGIPADDPRIITGGRFVTKIAPQHQEVYRRLISPLIGGLILESAVSRPLPDGSVMKTSVFGITTGTTTSPNGRAIPFFLANVYDQFLPMLGDHPEDALHEYHQQIVNAANEALTIGLVPYRLEPVGD